MTAAAQPFADDAPLTEAWDALRDLLALMAALFGAPAEVRATPIIDKRFALELRDFLGACETLLRRLLLLMAATLASNTPSPPRGRRWLRTAQPDEGAGAGPAPPPKRRRSQNRPSRRHPSPVSPRKAGAIHPLPQGERVDRTPAFLLTETRAKSRRKAPSGAYVTVPEHKSAGYANRYAAILAVVADPWKYAHKIARRRKPPTLRRTTIPRFSPLRGVLEIVLTRLPETLAPVDLRPPKQKPLKRSRDPPLDWRKS